MSHLQEQYKNPRQGFGNTGHGRIIRAYNQVKSRKEIRTRDFAKNRKLQDTSISISPHCVTDERAKRLLKWKEERDRKKKLANATKKPAFKVGIVHHSFYSPMNKDYTVPTGTVKSFNQVKPPIAVQKRVTRATEKRLLAKAAVNAGAKNTVKDIVNHKSVNHTKVEKSFAPDSHKFRPPSGLSKIPLFGVVAIEQTPSEKTDFFLNKPIECTAQNANNQERPQDLDLNTDTAVKISENSRLSSDKQKLSESTCNLNNAISDMNKIITTKLSLSEQNVQEPLQEEKSLPNNTDMETPVKSEKENCEEDLIFFSPYLTLSRGKKNARKEQMLRRGFSNSPSHTIPTKDTVMKNLNISVEEEERTAQYFKFLLNKEIDRLKELCTKWLNIRLEQDVPEDAMYEISQAVGQTNLLLNKKFERFRGLVLDCETGKGQMLVTCKDLQGFWDMTLMEVKDCDLRFEKLEQRRDRGWQEEQSIIVKPITKKRVTTKKQIVSSKPSSLRSLILAARRKKMTESSSIDHTLLLDTSINKDCFVSSSSILSPVASEENINTRDTRRSKLLDDNGFKSTASKRNNSRTSLVKYKNVQLSDKVKEMRSPLAIMKISKICKTPEIQLDDTISYINSDQTPGKSILKKTEEMVNNESRIKSAHKVIFDDQVALTEVSDDEESQTKRNLAAALSKIDSLDLDDLYSEKCIKVEKKLIFETEDSDSSGNFEFVSSEVQTLLKKKENAPKSSVCNIPDSTMCSLNDDITSAMSLKEVSAKDNKKDNKKTKSLRRSLRRQSQHKSTINNSTLEIPVINILPTTPLHANTETSITPKTPVIHETIFDAENTKQELDLEIKILRNRIITTNNTPKIKRESIMMTPKKASVSKKENKSPVTPNRKKSSKLLQMDEDNCTQSDENNVEINKNIYRKRRSSRKSVAFDAEACFVCAENKPVLPMTPHLKRGTPSRQSRSKRTFDENLMLKETAKSLNRVTRSHTKN